MHPALFSPALACPRLLYPGFASPHLPSTSPQPPTHPARQPPRHPPPSQPTPRCPTSPSQVILGTQLCPVHTTPCLCTASCLCLYYLEHAICPIRPPLPVSYSLASTVACPRPTSALYPTLTQETLDWTILSAISALCQPTETPIFTQLRSCTDAIGLGPAYWLADNGTNRRGRNHPVTTTHRTSTSTTAAPYAGASAEIEREACVSSGIETDARVAWSSMREYCISCSRPGIRINWNQPHQLEPSSMFASAVKLNRS